MILAAMDMHEPISISNPDKVNLTAYGVGTGRELFVTIINQTHAATHDSASATVTINANGFKTGSVSTMLLMDGEPGERAAMMTATLCGATIIKS